MLYKRLNIILDEKDAIRKELSEVSKNEQNSYFNKIRGDQGSEKKRTLYLKSSSGDLIYYLHSW
ncbi:hypothetical protein bcgnr5380_21570 [Bacillus cereus]